MQSGFTLLGTIETEEGIIRVYDNGLLESVINEGAYLEVPYLISSKSQVRKLIADKKFYVMNSGMGYFRISREARKLSATENYSDHIAAVAVITSHVAIEMVIDLYHKIDKPVRPTKAFTDKDLALNWLLERMEDDRLQKTL